MAQNPYGHAPVRQCLRPDRRKRTDIVAATAHLPAVLAGLSWLFDTVQPDDAVVDPQRHSLPTAAGRRYLRFDPIGRDGNATIEILRPVRIEPRGRDLAAVELSAFAEVVDGLGEEVVATWTGCRGVIGGVELSRPVHPTLLAAVERFGVRGAVTAGSAIDLRAVQRAMLHKEVAVTPFAGPWPDALDPSGVLGRVAAGVVANVLAESGRLGRG